jgi:hypothetical protein
MYVSLFLFCLPALITTILYLIPVFLPLFTPGKFPAAGSTGFRRQITLVALVSGTFHNRLFL